MKKYIKIKTDVPNVFVGEVLANQRLNSWTKSRHKSLEFSSLLIQSALKLCLEIYIYSNSRNLLQFLQSVTVYFKGERRKTWQKTISSSLWFMKSSLRTLKIMPNTSTKLYVHEFGFCTSCRDSYMAPIVVYRRTGPTPSSDPKTITYNKEGVWNRKTVAANSFSR